MAGTASTRSRTRDAKLSRQRLLAAAIDVFAQRGPQAATIDAICARAGLNKRLAYHYFGSKEGLYEQALSLVYQQFLSLEVSLSHMLLPADKLLEKLVRSYYEFLRRHDTFVRLISYENLNDGRVARRLNLHGQKAPVITALKLAIEKGQAEGRFREGIDAAELLISIFALCFFYFSNQHTMKQFLGKVSFSPQGLEARIKHVVGLILHGITQGGRPGATRRERTT